MPGGSRSSRWNDTDAEVACRSASGSAGRPRRPGPPAPGHLGLADAGQRFGHRGVGHEDDRLGGHQAAGGVRVVGQQPPQRSSPCTGSISSSSCWRLVARQLGEQVGGIVGLHLLDHVGGPGQVELGQQLDLVALGELLEDVGQGVVAERARSGWPAPRGAGHDLAGGIRGVHAPDVAEPVRQRPGVEEATDLVPVRDPGPTAEAEPAAVAQGHRGHHPARGPRWSDRVRPMSRIVSPPSSRPISELASTSWERSRNWPRSTAPVTICTPRASAQLIRDPATKISRRCTRPDEPEHGRRVVEPASGPNTTSVIEPTASPSASSNRSRRSRET